jgi:hypothetical protein
MVSLTLRVGDEIEVDLSSTRPLEEHDEVVSEHAGTETVRSAPASHSLPLTSSSTSSESSSSSVSASSDGMTSATTSSVTETHPEHVPTRTKTLLVLAILIRNALRTRFVEVLCFDNQTSLLLTVPFSRVVRVLQNVGNVNIRPNIAQALSDFIQSQLNQAAAQPQGDITSHRSELRSLTTKARNLELELDEERRVSASLQRSINRLKREKKELQQNNDLAIEQAAEVERELSRVKRERERDRSEYERKESEMACRIRDLERQLLRRHRQKHKKEEESSSSSSDEESRHKRKKGKHAAAPTVPLQLYPTYPSQQAFFPYNNPQPAVTLPGYSMPLIPQPLQLPPQQPQHLIQQQPTIQTSPPAPSTNEQQLIALLRQITTGSGSQQTQKP